MLDIARWARWCCTHTSDAIDAYRLLDVRTPDRWRRVRDCGGLFHGAGGAGAGRTRRGRTAELRARGSKKYLLKDYPVRSPCSRWPATPHRQCALHILI
jgi:hypothetical protein